MGEVITVEYHLSGGLRHHLAPVHLGDRPGSAACWHEGHPALVGYGWVDIDVGDGEVTPTPALWLHALIDPDGENTFSGAGVEVILHRLRDEPTVSKPGPVVHWRWRLVEG